MEQNENQDSIRERIRAYAFDLKLPLVRRDIDLLIQQGLDERWNLWMFTAELLRQEKENRSENQRRHRIKNAAFPQLRYLNEIDTDALPPEARKALPNLETLDFIKEGRNLILYGNPVPERPIWLQPWGLRPVTRDTPYCSLPCPDCLRR